MSNKTNDDDQLVPEELKAAAKQIAAVCKKYNLRMCEATLRPGLNCQFHDELTFTWQQGRHGEESNVVCLRYMRRVRLTVKEKAGEE
jgi:hypothetical protein